MSLIGYSSVYSRHMFAIETHKHINELGIIINSQKSHCAPTTFNWREETTQHCPTHIQTHHVCTINYEELRDSSIAKVVQTLSVYLCMQIELQVSGCLVLAFFWAIKWRPIHKTGKEDSTPQAKTVKTSD